MDTEIDTLNESETIAPKSFVEPLPFHIPSVLERSFQSGNSVFQCLGTQSATALASLLTFPESQAVNKSPHLVVVPHYEDVQAFKKAVRFFEPDVVIHELPAFDVSIYSNLYPNKRLVAQRLGWLYHAQNAKPGEIFVASVRALVQRTLPFQVLAQNSVSLKVGDELPNNFVDRLTQLGYTAVPLVEDVGSFAFRGGILDIYSPAHQRPVRIELFGDFIDSMRTFDPVSQRSGEAVKFFEVVPPAEVLFTDENRQQVARGFRQSTEGREVDREDVQEIQRSISHGQYFPGVEFLLPYFYDSTATALDHFSGPTTTWLLDPLELTRHFDELYAEAKSEYADSNHILIRTDFDKIYVPFEQLEFPHESKRISLMKIQLQDHVQDQEQESEETLQFRTAPVKDFSETARKIAAQTQELAEFAESKISAWKHQGLKVFVSTHTQSQAQRLKALFARTRLQADITEETDFLWTQWTDAQNHNANLIHIVPRDLPESLRFQDEPYVFLRDEDFFGRKRARREQKTTGTLESRAHALSFGDLKPGDYVVHKIHGIGLYEGLKVMPIQGVDAEFIQIKYKGKDRLYLPVYRIGQIQKFSGPTSPNLVDKLGGQAWEKTKTKVRNHLRDVASELLKLYAARSQTVRPPYSAPADDFLAFENAFAYDETDDQLRAIGDVVSDMTGEKPMDRLICGDVGFGKTEIAMRAAFKAVEDGKQVAVIAPTTVLSFQHFENFKKRFRKWPVTIRSLNRFVPPKEVKATLADLKEGKVDIVIGTHRLLSKDVYFKDIGLLIVDEEQKFGVRHKERLRKFRVNVDTLAMSATPIPRTLNMSLMGIRDLSIINTAPVDRLPTRTFVCKFDRETIRKAITSEIGRGGQVFFIHNRIQSIYALADELKEFLPEVRMRIAHGQMDEKELESTMMAFFNHEIDMLLCTSIVESGMDIPRANTMFIDNAHQFGLSQLYQLRGRVGRSKERAYCYLLVPAHRRIDADAQERLKVIQENTALGSGIRIAQYDLELRGTGDLLGEEQSGHINAVGHELYLELLEEAVREAKGEEAQIEDIEPEINVRIPALIPDSYISDIRVRLAYYKALTEVSGPEDLDRIEDELRDQFGKPPEPVINLMGLMLIRRYCKELGVRDLSSGSKTVSLSFTEHTPLPADRVVELASRPNKKYAVTPDMRLNIRMNEIVWPRIVDELAYLKTLCP